MLKVEMSLPAGLPNRPCVVLLLRPVARLALFALLLALVAAGKLVAQSQGLSVLHTFADSPDGANPVAGLVRDSAGNFYGTTQNGGANGMGTVFKIDRSGNFSVLHTFGGPLDGANPAGNLVWDSAGNLYGTTKNGGANEHSVGTVFRLDPWGNKYSVLYSFDKTFRFFTDWDFYDGAGPVGDLLIDSAGHLYGTLSVGPDSGGFGSQTPGAIFKLDLSGTNYSVLHVFSGTTCGTCSQPDGGDPSAGLILDGAGNLYGTTTKGGNGTNEGTVFKIDPSGNFTILHSFLILDGTAPQAPLTLRPDGYLYGTTQSGGAFTSRSGTVFRLDTAGNNFSVLHSFNGTDGAGPQAGLVVDGLGNLYGTTVAGGASSAGTVFRLDSSGDNFSILHSFSGADGANPSGDLVIYPSGNINGTTSSGGAQNSGVVFRLSVADLDISKFGQSMWTYGLNTTYLLSVHNSGPSVASNIIVTDELPAGMAFVQFEQSQGSCTAPAVGASGTVQCSLGNLSAGSYATIHITVKLTAPGGTVLTNAAVVASDETDPNPTNNSASFTTTVLKAQASVTLSNLRQTYDGTPKSVTVTTVPTVSAVKVTYNGKAAPINAGSYSVEVTVSDPYYFGWATGTLTINKANASLRLTNLNQTYDGTPKSVRVTTIPDGLTGWSVTYNGSATSPVNAGSYRVAASLQNPNYAASIVFGTLVIARASATVTAIPAGKTYGSPDPTLGASESGFTAPDAVSIILSATRAIGELVGSYTVRPAATGAALINYNVTYINATFTISPATPFFSRLASSQVITAGTSAITVSGTISAGSVFPPPGETVSISLNGMTALVNIRNNGTFSEILNPFRLPASTTPYPITYSYAGDRNFTSAIDASTSLTVTPPCPPGGPARFACTGSMVTVRHWHTATMLNDGTVLIAGGLSRYGDQTSALSTFEVYDSTGKFVRTVGKMNYPHAYHAATLLDNGTVLITGGVDSSGNPSANAEVYNPATGLFTVTRDISGNVTTLNVARDQHTATLLRCACPDDGKVLIAGGYNASILGTLSSAELYSPHDGTFNNLGGNLNLETARYAHTATALNDGLVLIAGGFNLATGELNSTELYDPSTQTFVYTSLISTCTHLPCLPITTTLNVPRFLHTATLLNDGRVLFAAGAENAGVAPVTTNSAEVYDPGSGLFTPTQDANNNVTTLNTARYFHSATLLNNGMVLIAGGQIDGNGTPTPNGELYDPATGLFTLTKDLNNNVTALNNARHVQSATLLNNGTVLFAGGVVSTVIPTADPSTLLATASAELYQPMTLTPLTLLSIAVTPANQTISPLTTLHFVATDTNTGQQLASVTWSSSNSSVAAISNDTSNLGTVFAVAPGLVTIQACAGSVCGSTTLTVK